MKSIKDQWKEQQAEHVDIVLEWAGDVSTLAKLCGVRPESVYGWVKRGRVSATAAAKIEDLSCGKIRKTDIRPDVAEWWL